jgi:hypothetical protein
MKRNFIWLSVFLIALLMVSCNSQPKGACVREAGIASTCGDDFTSGSCDMMYGKFYQGRTCAELGFRPN